MGEKRYPSIYIAKLALLRILLGTETMLRNNPVRVRSTVARDRGGSSLPEAISPNLADGVAGGEERNGRLHIDSGASWRRRRLVNLVFLGERTPWK